MSIRKRKRERGNEEERIADKIENADIKEIEKREKKRERKEKKEEMKRKGKEKS